MSEYCDVSLQHPGFFCRNRKCPYNIENAPKGCAVTARNMSQDGFVCMSFEPTIKVFASSVDDAERQIRTRLEPVRLNPEYWVGMTEIHGLTIKEVCLLNDRLLK